MKQKQDDLTTIHLTSDEAFLFIEFQKHYVLIGNLLGCMKELGIDNLRDSEIVIDIDHQGIIKHIKTSKHYSMKYIFPANLH